MDSENSFMLTLLLMRDNGFMTRERVKVENGGQMEQNSMANTEME